MKIPVRKAKYLIVVEYPPSSSESRMALSRRAFCLKNPHVDSFFSPFCPRVFHLLCLASRGLSKQSIANPKHWLNKV